MGFFRWLKSILFDYEENNDGQEIRHFIYELTWRGTLERYHRILAKIINIPSRYLRTDRVIIKVTTIKHKKQK